ncbi:MAG: hypothetical protein AB7D51_01390 [Desulfovibrionaceae bacterium]
MRMLRQLSIVMVLCLGLASGVALAQEEFAGEYQVAGWEPETPETAAPDYEGRAVIVVEGSRCSFVAAMDGGDYHGEGEIEPGGDAAVFSFTNADGSERGTTRLVPCDEGLCGRWAYEGGEQGAQGREIWVRE